MAVCTSFVCWTASTRINLGGHIFVLKVAAHCLPPDIMQPTDILTWIIYTKISQYFKLRNFGFQIPQKAKSVCLHVRYFSYLNITPVPIRPGIPFSVCHGPNQFLLASQHWSKVSAVIFHWISIAFYCLVYFSHSYYSLSLVGIRELSRKYPDM